MIRIVQILLATTLLAGCFGNNPQLARYQADRDAMMATSNPDKN
jgi:hypothetical protein